MLHPIFGALRNFTTKSFVLLKPALRSLIPNRLLGEELCAEQKQSRKVIGRWLLGCAGMVYGAVALGGITRLTESGLSMVNWDLFKTMKPPFNNKEWKEEFERYKQYPEYKFKTGDNADMTIGEFKFIWSMEYLHRMWGRAIGIVFFVPCFYFWVRKQFSIQMKIRMVLAGSLLLSQGLLGWYMVKSGLDPSKNSNVDVPRVSQYRLTSHLSLAFVLYSIYFWTALSHILKPYDYFLCGFVAGLDAGLVYNSWPKFADKWIPENLLSKIPKWKNVFENEVTVQFIHRNLAYLTLVSITMTWLVGRRLHLNTRAKCALHGMMMMGYLQALLGISTLIYFVPTWLAALHQNGSMALLSFAFWLSNEIRRVPK